MDIKELLDFLYHADDLSIFVFSNQKLYLYTTHDNPLRAK